MATKRPKSSGSGHGPVTERTLSATMVANLKRGIPQYINIAGVKKQVHLSNIHRGRVIKWYKRSDTKKIALCRPGVDKKRTSQYRPHSKIEPYTGDARQYKPKGGY